VHLGFSVFAGPPVEVSDIASLESQARYITRPVLAMDALEKHADGNLIYLSSFGGALRKSSLYITLSAIVWKVGAADAGLQDKRI